MALIKCPECGKEVSDTCDKCIHCGYQLKKQKNTVNYYFTSESKASKIYERNEKLRWFCGIVVGGAFIVFAIVFLILAFTLETSGVVVPLVIPGIILLFFGIITIVYCIYRIKTY